MKQEYGCMTTQWVPGRLGYKVRPPEQNRNRGLQVQLGKDFMNSLSQFGHGSVGTSQHSAGWGRGTASWRSVELWDVQFLTVLKATTKHPGFRVDLKTLSPEPRTHEDTQTTMGRWRPHSRDIATDKPRNAKMVATIRSQERGKRCFLLQSPSKNRQCWPPGLWENKFQLF